MRYATTMTIVVAAHFGQPRRSSGYRTGCAMITTTAATATGARISRPSQMPAKATTAAATVRSTRVPCASPARPAPAPVGASVVAGPVMSEAPDPLADHGDADHEEEHRHDRRVVVH